jgi:hypothetical protein
MKLLIYLFILFIGFTSFIVHDKNAELIYHDNRYMRSSFCLYNDGKFYETKASGCTHQLFAWGNYTKKGDSIYLDYQPENIFTYDIVFSKDTSATFQIVQILDCYNKPVRFQHLNHKEDYSNLYNTGIIKLPKNNSYNYPIQSFDDKPYNESYFTNNADTISFRWRCNRESIESISDGSLIVNNRASFERAYIQGLKVEKMNN